LSSTLAAVRPEATVRLARLIESRPRVFIRQKDTITDNSKKEQCGESSSIHIICPIEKSLYSFSIGHKTLSRLLSSNHSVSDIGRCLLDLRFLLFQAQTPQSLGCFPPSSPLFLQFHPTPAYTVVHCVRHSRRLSLSMDLVAAAAADRRRCGTRGERSQCLVGDIGILRGREYCAVLPRKRK